METLLIIVTFLIMGVTVVLVGSNREGFTGSRIRNPDSYLLDIERMNGTDQHTLELQAGDVLQIQFDTGFLNYQSMW